MGQWQSVVIIPSLYGTNNWIQTCPITVGVHNTTKIVTSHVNVFTVLTWRLCQCIPTLQDKWSYSPVCSSLCCVTNRIIVIALQDCKLCAINLKGRI
jgi:hypothetical protein